MKRLLIAVAVTLTYNEDVLAERLIAHVCWMGGECIKEYLISSNRHGQKVEVSIRDDSIVNGRTTSKGTIENLTVSCNKKPAETHANAVEYTRWMYVCAGERTDWSPK